MVGLWIVWSAAVVQFVHKRRVPREWEGWWPCAQIRAICGVAFVTLFDLCHGGNLNCVWNELLKTSFEEESPVVAVLVRLLFLLFLSYPLLKIVCRHLFDLIDDARKRETVRQAHLTDPQACEISRRERKTNRLACETNKPELEACKQEREDRLQAWHRTFSDQLLFETRRLGHEANRLEHEGTQKAREGARLAEEGTQLARAQLEPASWTSSALPLPNIFTPSSFVSKGLCPCLTD